jgi:thiosulfate/3-mercaptopyruvate sulfurtransferase
LPRYVIIGAGAIGVTLAAELHRSGHPVALIARGAQLRTARADGITYARPHGLSLVKATVYGGPDELRLTGEDVLVLATKTQDAAVPLAQWSEQPVSLAGGERTTAGAALPLLTTQNGLETERIALRHFETVYGGVLALAATYVEPGVVVAPSAPSVGIAWIGAFPDRPEPRLEALARDLRRANLETRVVNDISRFKNAKLVLGSTFVLDALYEPGDLRDRAAVLLRAETAEILKGAGGIADLETDMAQLLHRIKLQEVPGYERGGSSTWQSLTRSGSLETDFINGEVVLQARLQKRTAPVNRALTDRIHAAQRDRTPARSLSDDDLLATVPQLTDPADRRPDVEGTAPRRRPTTASHDEVLIDARSLHRELLGPNPPAVLDVRWKLGDPDGRAHYAERHIPTAVYVDLDTELAGPPSPEQGRHPIPDLAALQRAAWRWGIRQGQRVVVYDDLGGMSAARAWWLLRWAGVSDVRILDGALGAWLEQRLPVEAGELLADPGDVVLEPGRLPVLDAAQAAEAARTGVLLDARAGERYRGEQEPVDPRAGHIPGALSTPTATNLGPDRRFLDPATLRERFESAGVDDGQPLGVYCGSGVTAAHLLAALRIAGFDAALYPGSWSAWSSDPERPVAIGPDPLGRAPDVLTTTGATRHAS